MSDNNLTVGAGVGLIAGAGAGLVQGAKKAKAILAPYTPAMNAGAVGSDTFIKEQAKYVSNKMSEAGNVAKILKEKSKNIAPQMEYKFKDGFRRMVEHLPDVKKLAKTTKIKSIAILAAAGTAIGTGIALAVNKIKAAKAQKAE